MNEKMETMMKRTVLATVALGALLTAAVPVFAQGGPGGPGGGPAGGPGGPGPRFERMCEDHEARLAGALAFAETKLKITDTQRPAWAKFVTAVKNSDSALEKRCADPAKAKMPETLPERAQFMEEMTAAHLEQIRQVRPALNELYGTFTPEQKKTADEMVERFMRHGPGGLGHGPGMRGHHGPGPDGDHGDRRPG
jgi:periplasmic protein CpxP/Spy